MSRASGKPSILLIDADAEEASQVRELLEDRYSLTVVTDATRGWEAAVSAPHPSLILLDPFLPDSDGLALCRRLADSPLTGKIPVLIVSKHADPATELLAIKAGAADFLAKPLHGLLAKAKIRRLLEKAAAASGQAPAERGGTPQCERLKAEIERQKEALVQVGQELQTFSYSISHDLRAPLRHLVGFSAALMEDHRDQLQGTAQMYLDCIGKAARKMESLLDALLSLSRVGGQEMTSSNVDVSLLARECAASLQAKQPERQVDFRIQEGLYAQGDLMLLRTVLCHLLENAWKFTGKNEHATIVFGRAAQGGAFFVSDNGVGFDMKYSSRLFGPFQRLHQEGEFEGIGIGLATVQRIIRRHGGKVWAEAKVDEGATFYFTVAS